MFHAASSPEAQPESPSNQLDQNHLPPKVTSANNFGIDVLYDPFIYQRPRESGGLESYDEEKLKGTRKALWSFVKTAGKQILMGNLLRITLPVGLACPRSLLETVSDNWAYAPVYLRRAAAAQDPMERFRLTIAFVFAGIHRTALVDKPFNPVLGETVQGVYSDGTTLAMEQVSHHPPISCWDMQSAAGAPKFRFYGRGITYARFSSNACHAGLYARCCIEFQDGTRIVYNFPKMIMSGCLVGRLGTDYTGYIVFEDEKNGLIAHLKFDADDVLSKSMFSFGRGSLRKSDAVEGALYSGCTAAAYALNGLQAEDMKQSLLRGIIKEKVMYLPKPAMKIEGSWIEELKFTCLNALDGAGISAEAIVQLLQSPQDITPSQVNSDPIWTLGGPDDTPETYKRVGMDVRLESDASLREDCIVLLTGDLEAAQLAKNRVEVAQRRDASLRK